MVSAQKLALKKHWSHDDKQNVLRIRSPNQTLKFLISLANILEPSLEPIFFL